MKDPFAEQLQNVVELVRALPLDKLVAFRQARVKALHIGPLLHSAEWTTEAYNRESSNLDIYRRVEDLRRAIIEADELQARQAEQSRAVK